MRRRKALSIMISSLLFCGPLTGSTWAQDFSVEVQLQPFFKHYDVSFKNQDPQTREDCAQLFADPFYRNKPITPGKKPIKNPITLGKKPLILMPVGDAAMSPDRNFIALTLKNSLNAPDKRILENIHLISVEHGQISQDTKAWLQLQPRPGFEVTSLQFLSDEWLKIDYEGKGVGHSMGFRKMDRTTEFYNLKTKERIAIESFFPKAQGSVLSCSALSEDTYLVHHVDKEKSTPRDLATAFSLIIFTEGVRPPSTKGVVIRRDFLSHFPELKTALEAKNQEGELEDPILGHQIRRVTISGSRSLKAILQSLSPLNRLWVFDIHAYLPFYAQEMTEASHNIVDNGSGEYTVTQGESILMKTASGKIMHHWRFNETRFLSGPFTKVTGGYVSSATVDGKTFYVFFPLDDSPVALSTKNEVFYNSKIATTTISGLVWSGSPVLDVVFVVKDIPKN